MNSEANNSLGNLTLREFNRRVPAWLLAAQAGARARVVVSGPVVDAAQAARNAARRIVDVSAFIKDRIVGGGVERFHSSPDGLTARAGMIGRRWKGDKRRAQRARAALARQAKRQAAADAAADMGAGLHPDRAFVLSFASRAVAVHVGFTVGADAVAVRSVLGQSVVGRSFVVEYYGARVVPLADAESYRRFWADRPLVALADAARRATRSIRTRKVSVTSRDEATAAARAAFVARASEYVNAGFCDWYHAAQWATVCQTTQRAAVAAARAALRGDGRGGITGEGREAVPMVEGPDCNPVADVWSVERGEWVAQVDDDGAACPFKRAGADKFVDAAGRLFFSDDTADDDGRAERIGADALALCEWLASRQQFDMVAARASLFGAAETQAQSAARQSARARRLELARRVAAVLAGMAAGDSLAMACRSVGWSDANGCIAWRQAVNRLTGGAGLASAWRDYRADQRAAAE